MKTQIKHNIFSTFSKTVVGSKHLQSIKFLSVILLLVFLINCKYDSLELDKTAYPKPTKNNELKFSVVLTNEERFNSKTFFGIKHDFYHQISNRLPDSQTLKITCRDKR